MDLKGKLLAMIGKRFGAQYPITPLFADRPTGQKPMQLNEVDEHTEHYLALKSGEEMVKGMPTGMLGGMGGAGSILIGLGFLADGDIGWFSKCIGAALAFFAVPFAWEMLHPLPLPTLFNRRTREVYFELDGELYHTPWDGIEAATYEYEMVHQNTGAMRHAPIEVLMHRYGKPEQQVLVNLVVPICRSIAINQHTWEYLRAYMNNGPWFDEDGANSPSDAFVREQMAVNQRNHRDAYKITWKMWREDGRSTTLALMIGELFFYPKDVVQDFVYALSKRRSRNQWPEEVLERLRPDGPTTRLIDVERAQGLPAGVSACSE
ncbi:hypothetical protein BZL41_09820 [Pseudomonas sp. PIC25]|uniref:DUF6708 domain-containing protein n=1 Tax=Pseudomonas sp. PIC25 TaxID=1958773 RepID=UPI000BCEBA46|nr:DUF6708 domain-containing protein [Pseudomonas sp. PIC25]PAU64479.1 hypothetical protein BZL41_09820 [Pseudomonas sp. PIC25]